MPALQEPADDSEQGEIQQRIQQLAHAALAAVHKCSMNVPKNIIASLL